uniref:Uncharacterized protein n=1 Tax=Anguilla anguilla TaxID=7936 RepID=A0A0E9QDX7_ANGAN
MLGLCILYRMYFWLMNHGNIILMQLVNRVERTMKAICLDIIGH